MLELPLPPRPEPRGLYIHIPFCFHKCHYCDFYSLVDSRDRQAAFAARLVAELLAFADLVRTPLETIFAGGGTPTLLESHLWSEILLALRGSLPEPVPAPVPAPGACEFTVEANPETVTAELLEVLRGGGVNRLSIGCQSFDRRHLRTLERHHDPENVERSVKLAREAGFDSFNLDLIFGIPGQTLEDWSADLERALQLRPPHVSCYALTYEPNTPLTARLKAGQITPVDEDLEAAMYEHAVDRLKDAGLEHYEISAWARPGHRCRHNLLYWTNGDWWPLGPGAAGHVRGLRWKNAPRLDGYLEQSPFPPIVDVELPDPGRAAGETLMLGLRLVEGIECARVAALLGASGGGARRREAIDRHLESGLLEERDGRLRLTRRGLLLADTVIADLV